MSKNSLRRIEKSTFDTEKILISLSDAIKNLNHSSEIIAENNSRLTEMISVMSTKIDERMVGITSQLGKVDKTLQVYSKFILISFAILAGLIGLQKIVSII